MTEAVTETIAAIATPPGRGGIGIVRLSGPAVPEIARVLLGACPEPRRAVFRIFTDSDHQAIDEGIALYFPAPDSFTGEHVLELQGHGGPIVLDQLLKRALSLGARPARPGEFSERAYLNDKLDLTQAEAIADLIDSETVAAARLATRSLQGEFSRRIHDLAEQLTRLRMYLEAAIDFPEEEIDFLSDGKVIKDLDALFEQTRSIQKSARIGRLMRDGMRLVIAGQPNVGKSSLLNALAESDSAIVTEIPGTTRDLLHEHIQIDGMPLHLVDTAGLRESDDPIEQEGVRRARSELASADLVLWVYDAGADPDNLSLQGAELPGAQAITSVRNKIDIANESASTGNREGQAEIALSAKTGEGIELLRQHLKSFMGLDQGAEGDFMARRRHLDAIKQALTHMESARDGLLVARAAELAAEDLRQAQRSLGLITGEVTADDLLGEIFSSFCIGK